MTNMISSKTKMSFADLSHLYNVIGRDKLLTNYTSLLSGW